METTEFRPRKIVRGFGTWYDDLCGLVINSSDGPFTPAGLRLPNIDPKRHAIYLPHGQQPAPPAFRAVSEAQYHAVIQKIRDGLSQWQYQTDQGADLLLGWLVNSVFLGAADSRPSLLISAPFGSDRDSLQLFLSSCLGSYAWSTGMTGKESKTEDGIRKKLSWSASPCILYGMDRQEKGRFVLDRQVMDQIIPVMRSSYTDGYMDDYHRPYHTISSFCLMSIADLDERPAGAGQLTLFRVGSLGSGEGVDHVIRMLSKEESAIFFWGTIHRWKRYQYLLVERCPNISTLWGEYATDDRCLLMAASMAVTDAVFIQ